MNPIYSVSPTAPIDILRIYVYNTIVNRSFPLLKEVVMATTYRYEITADSSHLPAPSADEVIVFDVKPHDEDAPLLAELPVVITYVGEDWGPATARIEGYVACNGERAHQVRGYCIVSSNTKFEEKTIGLVEVSTWDD